MQKNVSTVDRTLRIIVGLLLLAVGFLAEGPARYLGWAAFVPLFTGLVGICPIYNLFGRQCCHKSEP